MMNSNNISERFRKFLKDELGLPKRTKRIEIVIDTDKPIIIKCEYYPVDEKGNIITLEDGLLIELAEYRLVRVQ